MEKYVTASYSITAKQALKVMELAKEKANDLGMVVSGSQIIRTAIDKMPNPKKKK